MYILSRLHGTKPAFLPRASMVSRLFLHEWQRKVELNPVNLRSDKRKLIICYSKCFNIISMPPYLYPNIIVIFLITESFHFHFITQIQHISTDILTTVRKFGFWQPINFHCCLHYNRMFSGLWITKLINVIILW